MGLEFRFLPNISLSHKRSRDHAHTGAMETPGQHHWQFPSLNFPVSVHPSPGIEGCVSYHMPGLED